LEIAVEHQAPEYPVSDLLVTVLCGIVVAFYAARRYDTPETNRHSTTQSLFLLTGAGYVTASLTLFFLLCEIILKPGVLPFLGLDQAQETVKKFTAPPVLAAVILTTLLPNVAVLSAWDAWVLKRFQTWGSIPHGVRNLADTMTPNALLVTEITLSDLRSWIFSDEYVSTNSRPT
jgi:hypothetical protein